MLSLHELQRRFAAGLGGEANALDGVVRAGTFSAAERLRIYRNNYNLSLTAALGDVYPVVQQLVGEGFFGWLAHKFVAVHPSRSGNLHDFGAELPAFLESFEAAAELPYLPDVARIEWGWHAAFHAADVEPFPLEHLAAVPAEAHEHLRFAVRPGMTLVASAFPASEIWEAHQPDGDADAEIDLGAGAEWVLVLRNDHGVQVVRLAPGMYAMLEAMIAGATFGDACTYADESAPDTDLGGALRDLMALGALIDFDICQPGD
ncbi:MAG: DNA-binding domain-containing protein [Pseudomonadota bacterium]